MEEKIMSSTTLPGFLLTIEDNQTTTVEVTAVKDVHVIYAVLPETMKYEDEDGNYYDKFIEPNKPLLIATGGIDEAINTLEISDIELTREVKNMLALMPSDATIALCRIVTRNGEQPDEDNLAEMYEALDFAFEMTENYPIKEIYCAGISLDKAVALKANEFTVKVGDADEAMDAEELAAMVTEVRDMNGSNKVASNKNFEFAVEAERYEGSLTEETGKGILNKFTFYIDDAVAKVYNSDNGTETFEIIADIDYTNPTVPVVKEVKCPGNLKAALTIVDNALNLVITGSAEVIIDEEAVIDFKGSSLVINTLGQAPAGELVSVKAAVNVSKVAYDADILTRILKHNSTITATQNNCLTFMSPEPPKNSSAKAIVEYVDRCINLQEQIRERCVTTSNGKKIDLGMFLSVPVGVNRIDSIGGVTGFSQATIATISGNVITTQKLTSSFEVGDLVEVYTNNKLDIEMVSGRVTGVSVSANETTEITLDVEIPQSIIGTRTPKYIMNVNNKDFNGNYMAIQYSNICREAGVERSPAGLVWTGECQVMFSEAQKNKLNALKYAVLVQKHGTTSGEIDKSQLMTGVNSQFQDYENIAVIYNIVAGCKEIAMNYKGQRINDSTDLALIKTEMEDAVFNPGVGVFITSGYELTLRTAHLQATGGRKEKALFIDFTVTEIETLKLLRMTARLS
jgi:hypothetical protein